MQVAISDVATQASLAAPGGVGSQCHFTDSVAVNIVNIQLKAIIIFDHYESCPSLLMVSRCWLAQKRLNRQLVVTQTQPRAHNPKVSVWLCL